MKEPFKRLRDGQGGNIKVEVKPDGFLDMILATGKKELSTTRLNILLLFRPDSQL